MDEWVRWMRGLGRWNGAWAGGWAGGSMDGWMGGWGGRVCAKSVCLP